MAINMAFLEIEGKNAASVLFFSNGKVLMGYNSGYVPLFTYYSPGLMGKVKLMQWAIENGFHKFDTLRGMRGINMIWELLILNYIKQLLNYEKAYYCLYLCTS
jgi:hypothetical protein